MTHKIYALLVGIDNYHPQSRVNSLKGCVNDIEAIETYLRKRIATDKKWELVENSVVPWKLTNDLATRQAVIDGFLQHLCQADSEDVVLFYYAGHGSYETAPEFFRKQERDGKIETLVCYDSRTSEGRDLADKELSYLIEQVAKKDPHILIILDSCHSGTATRDPEVVERQTNPDGKVRDLKDFLFPEEWLNNRLSNRYEPPKHVAIAACRDFQTAKEHIGSNSQRRGAFSYFLTEALQRTNSNLSYANLVQDINALITGKVKDQSPQIEATSDDLIQSFLGGAAGETINYFTLSYDSNTHRNWVINGGILHGIRPTSEGETRIAIFPQGSTPEQLQEIENAICQAKLTQVFTEVSIAEISGDSSQLSQDKPYWAIVTEIPLPKLKVYFQGDDGGVELARIALSSVNAGKPSLFIRETKSLADADYYLEAIKGQFWIKQVTDKQPLVAPVPDVPDNQGYTQQCATKIIKRLEHIARWKNILELKTPPTSQIAYDVEMEVIITSGENQYSSKTEPSALRGEYTWKDNKWEKPRVEIKVTNKSDQDLYFQVIELAGSFAIEIPPFFEEKGSIVFSKKTINPEPINGKKLKIGINKKYLDSEITEYDTIFKLIVSTREFNANLLLQPALDSPPPVKRSSGLSGALNRLMDKVYTRETELEEDEYIDNWMTQEVKITLIKPPGGIEIKETESTTLMAGVELQGHPSFKGKFSLNPLPPSSRDVNSNLIPPIFLQDPTVLQRNGGRKLVEAYEFNKTRSPDSFSILEIVDVHNHESVTPENPIKLLIGDQLLPGEYILPVAYDGEFFLPLGKAKTRNGKTEITIERLPEPTVDSRSLQGSIKILFQKVFYESAGKQLGWNFPYPLLRIASVSENGRVNYNANIKEIQTQVASAKKILLYIHGIIGDTESLLPSVLAKTTDNGQQKTLQDKYDLVLAFDYENIKTTIQENAKLLKQKLEEVGLTAKEGKKLDIVAHSMGGLVSRTFIEKENGKQIVQHLVMLGTPNAGSPWPQIQDWAFTALGIGLNGLSRVAWPVNIIAALLAFLESQEKALNQMKPDGDFIQSITQNTDPNVQYTIIAGDRSIRPSALEIEPGKNSSQIKRLMQKLFGSAVDSVIDTVFLQQPNDIAVTLESIKSISLKRTPQPRIISPDVACDHLTYFTTQAGLDALVQALCNNS
ncbi:caspase family protein [Scytonema sp. PCC 10023]|uniref:caspase family protein n=1 Tax=Scytonema sp. PCC 10023 TaxID=1680591 RepID=UPI0039C72FFA